MYLRNAFETSFSNNSLSFVYSKLFNATFSWALANKNMQSRIAYNANIIYKENGYIDGLMHARRNSTAQALELRLPSTDPSIRQLDVHSWV